MTARKLAELVSDVKAAGWAVAPNEDGMTAKSPDGVQEVGIKYDPRGVFVEAWVEFPDQERRVRLKNASAVRQQVVKPLDSKPVRVYAGREHTAEKPLDELPLDAREILPFSLDDPTPAIIAVLAGKRVVWRNTEMNRIEAARLPESGRAIRVITHPRYRRRMIVWRSDLGPSAVLLDRIRRVLP